MQQDPLLGLSRQVGSVVSVSDSWPGGCELDPRFRRIFFPVCFCLSLLQKHVRKVVGSFGRKSCLSTGVRKPGNMCASPTAMIWPYLLNWRNKPQYNQPLLSLPIVSTVVTRVQETLWEHILILYQHFLLFLQSFQNFSVPGPLKLELV